MLDTNSNAWTSRAFRVGFANRAPGPRTPPVVVPSMVGWRLWMVYGSGEPDLYSPYRMERERWTGGRLTRAKCAVNPNHYPPSPLCRCGVFAVESLLDVVFRVHHCDWAVRDDPEFYAPNPPSAVFGRVNLTRVIRGGMRNPHNGRWQPDLRAGQCELDTLFVPPSWAGSRPPKVLAAELRDRYGVRAKVGYPKVTEQDRKSRPEWLGQGISQSEWPELRIPEPLLSEMQNV